MGPLVEKQVELKTRDGEMKAFVVSPPSAGTHPAMIVIQEVFGVNSHVKDVCRRWAKQGYVALAPEIFHRSGHNLEFPYTDFAKIKPIFSALTNEMLLEDVRASFEFLQKNKEVSGDKVYCIGHCLGGFVAMLAACNLPLKGAISYYGGGMVAERPGIALQPLLGDFHKIKCAVQLAFGGQDSSISPSDIEAVSKKLQECKVDFSVQIYPEAGHAFTNDDRPNFHKASAEKSWADTLTWLKTH